MKRTLALLAILTALVANAQVWTTLPPDRQAAFIKVYNNEAAEAIATDRENR